MTTEAATKETISESPSDGATAAIDSSIANETAKDEALCTVAVGTLDSSKGESLVEAPKETVSKHAEIVTAELKNEGDLTSNGNNTEAKGKKVITAKEVAESGSSDVNVMAIDEVKATDESASPNRLQQKDQDQDNNIVHVQVTKFDMVEASEAQVEDKEDEGTTDIEKLEANEDNIKREAENGMLSDDSTNGIYNTPAVEPFEQKNSNEPLEIMNEDLETADKFESPTVAVLEEPDVEKFERVNGGEQVKGEAETGIFNDERTNVIDSISVAEPSEEGSTEESLEKTSKEELEPAEGEQEQDKPESFQEPEEEKHKRVNEDDIKIEAETEICDDKRIDDDDSTSVAEPSDKEIEQEPPEITAKDGPEPAKEKPEHGKLESSLDALPDEPEEKELERVNEDINVKAEAENVTRDDERTKDFEPEHEKLEKYLDAVTGEPEEELERVIEDKKIKMEAEAEICADERTTDADSTKVAEPSENENIQEPIEITVKKAHESAEDVPEHSKRESTHDAVLEKTEASMLPDNDPDSCGLNKNHENVTTNKEDLVMNVEECSLEGDKEYEPIKKEAINLLPEYESASVGGAAATHNCSISHDTAKEEALCTVAVGTLDSSDGEIIVEAPKENVLNYVEIVSEELKNEGDLTNNKDSTEAKDEKVITAKELPESESSDVNVMAIDKERATDESASQDILHQKDQDDNIVHAQAKNFDMVEASEALSEDEEDEGATDIEKLEVNGDNIKKEAENEMLSDESSNGIDNTPAAEPLEKKNSKEPHEIMNKDLEPADKLESPIDAVPEEPDVEKLERVNEDEHVKVEAETGILNDERPTGIESISVEEPSEKGNTQESLEKTSKEELEAAEDEPEHDKLKSFPEPEEEKLGRVNEDNAKIEGEPENCADERIDDADSMSVAEPSDKEIKQESLEISVKKDPEPATAKDEPEHGKLKSSLDPVAHELEEKELERINEDKNVKVEAESGIHDDKRTDGIDSTSTAEPSDKENRQEPLEMTAKENLESEKDEPEHEKLEKSLDAVTEEPEEKLERVIEDKKIKMEAETEICDDERTADAESTPVLEPSENENREKPLEITAKEDLEPAEDVPEHSEPDGSVDAVLQKPVASMLPDNGPESSRLNRNHENETTSKEDLVVTLEECSLEDEKKYEPVEKEAFNFLPEYESTSVGGAAATDNCSISHDTAKEEASCTVAVGTLDSSDGEIIVEAPKENVLKYVEIVSEELKNEGDLTNNGDSTEAKDEKVITAKELPESESSDVNVMAIDKERATDESASQDILHQKDQDDNIVHAQAKNFHVVEASEALAEDKEDEGATDIEKLEVNGDNIKKEAENGMLSDESSNGIDNTPAAEPLEKTNSKEPHEIMNKDLEPADKLESPIDAVPEEPDVEKLERVNEDEHVKVEAETGILNDERPIGIESISVEEPSEKGNTQESLEKTSKEELEAAEDEPEHDKLKSFPEPEEEKLGRVNEDNVKIEGEPENCADERIDDAYSMSVAEPSDKEIKQESLEISVKEDPEPATAKDEPEHGKLKSSLDPVANELEEKELERINEDKNVKVEAESGIRDDKRNNGIDSTSTAEPSDKENRQEPLEMTAKDNLEPEKDELEHEKLEKSLDAVTEEPEEKLERVIEDKKIKMEAETEICDDEGTDDAESTPVLEPSENENRQKPLEITAKEDIEPAEEVPEHSEPESSLDAVLQKPEASMLPDNGPESSGLNRNHENETTSKEDLVMTLEECSLEDENKYEPVEKEAFNFLPEYEDSMTKLGTETVTAIGTVTASKLNEKNEEDTVDDFTVTQEIILEKIKGLEMHETAISEEVIHDADDKIEQIGRETEAENLNKISETTVEDQNNNKIADAETTNFISDDCANQKKELDTLCTSKVSVEENIENVIDAGKSTEQSSEKVDDNESNERYTQGTHELETENALHESIEDKDNIDSISKAEQTSKKTTGVSLNTEQMGNEKVNEGSEVNQQKDPSEEVVASVISSDESSTEQGPNHDPKEDSGEDQLKIDTVRCEKIIITEHNAFADDIEEKNHVEKQENFKNMDEVASVLEGTTASADNPSCKADDKDEKVRDDDRNDSGEELEEASNLICENQACETINGEGYIEVSNSNEKAPEEFELVSELVPALKSQETRTETEGTQIEKSNFDENSSDKTTNVDGSGNDTEAANGEKESSSEYDVVKGTTYGGSEIHEGATVGMSFCKEQKVTEKLDSNNELEQGKEPSVAVEENAADETLESAVQKENWDEKLEGPSKVVSGKTIVAEESTFIQEGEKEDPSEKHEECFVEKGEVVILGQAVSRMDTEDQNSKPENIHIGNDKPEEIPNSVCEEQPQETINGSIGIEVDGEERELSQKLELVSNSVAEDKNQEIIRQKDFDVSTNDCILLNMISEIIKKNDDKENMKEANLNKAFDDCCDSHVSIEETINNEVGQKKEDGPSSANEDQNYQATDTTDKLEVHVSEEKDIQHNIFQVSPPEDRCQNETGESDAIKIDNSTNDDSKTMMPGAPDLNNDAETAKEKGEENLNTAKEDCSDDHTSIAPILPEQISEHEDSSKTEHGEQIYQVINDECSTEVDIHKETADPEEFEKITESIPKDHNQGDVNEPKSTDNSDNTDHLDKAIPEITSHSDDPETAKVKDDDVLEKDFSYKCDDQELVPGAADCEDNKEASMQQRKENLDINMELGPEDLKQDVICETESVKVKKELNIDENEINSAVRTEYTTDATSGAKLEKTSVEDSYELESDDKQENTNMFENREEEMPKEETAGHILDKTLSTVNINTTEDISENQIEGKVGANNANSEIIGCEQNQATEEEIPEVANRDQNKESYDRDDGTKNGATSEEVKVSDTADVAKNLTETVEVQISEDASQVMKADSDECQDYEENDEYKENTSTSQMLEKSVRNENEEKTNEIRDDLPVTRTPSDEATYGNLHKNEGEKATKEGYGTGDDIPNQEANESDDGELKDKGSITISDDNVSDIPALDEETGQVENAHQKTADSSYGEQIHESISISEGANLDALIIDNKTEQKSYKSNGASESNENVSFKETTENDSEKEKLEDLEPEKSTHAVIEDLETTIGAEGIHENETNKESTEHKNEENFLKDRDMKLVESAIELEPDHQSNKSIYPAEGDSPSEETLNVKDLVDDVTKEEAHNEEKHCRNYDVSVAHNLVEESTDMEGEEPHPQKHSMELEIHGKTEQNDSIVAQNEEITERSETLKLHKDTKELIEQSSNTLLGSQEIATPIENIDKNIMPDEDAAEADLEQIPDDETEAKENSEQVTDTVPNDEVKEDNHQTSKELVMGSTENLITSPDTASQAEETKQEVGEQFSKISDYWPRGYNEEASMVSTVDAVHPKETMSVVEQPGAEQIKHTSTDSTVACEIEEQGTEVYVPEDSGLDTIDKDGREELKEDADSMPQEVVKKIGSSVEPTQDRENPHEESAVKEPQVDQPDVVTETEELTDKAGHEVEVDNLQEEKQQTGLGELPVSQFLMKYILQEEGDALNKTRDGEYEDVSNKKNDGDKQKEGKIPKQEDKSAPLSVVQLTEKASTPEDKVGSEKLKDSTESVQAEEGYEEEGYEGKENSDITVFKDGPSLQSTLDESTSLVVTEDGKDEVDILSSEMSNNITRDESMEVNSTEQNSQGSTVNNDHCKPDLVQDEKIKGIVLEETLTQEEIQKDNETLDKEVDVSTVGKTSEENNLQKEGGEESKECLQDVVKAEGSYEVSDGQSTMDDSEYGEILEIKSEIEKVECGDEKQEVGNQVQILKNDSTEELTLSEQQIIQQTGLVNEAKIHALDTTEKFMEDKNSEIILDRKQMVEAKVDENKADEEKHENEEREEFKPEKSSSNAEIVETKESELKPIQKCEQTRKSSESSTTEDHQQEETLQLLSEFKIAGSGEKKQDVVNQNQVQTNNGLNEEENLSDSATQPLYMAEKLEEQNSVANVDENHDVQITKTKVDENKAGDEKNEKAEKEEDEHNPEESGQNSTINVEAREAELKPTPKKSHGLLSGVGSKVKHSIAKVKKAITGKSSHSKTVSAK